MSMTDYIDERYDDTYESIYLSLAEMVRKDRDKAGQYIREILRNMYIRQGNDWTGRGAIGNAGLDASIAAYECILAEMYATRTTTTLLQDTCNYERSCDYGIKGT